MCFDINTCYLVIKLDKQNFKDFGKLLDKFFYTLQLTKAGLIEFLVT